jgi:putative hydrolase of the HAD superfamily
MKSNRSKKEARIKGVLFDIGDTLIDASQIMIEALDKATDSLHLNGYITDKRKFKQAYREVDKSIHGSHINHLFSDICIIKKTWQKLELQLSYAAYGIFLVAFRNHVRARISVNEEIVKLFKLLKDKGLKLGIVSDGTVTEQLETLVYLGVIRYLDAIVVSEDFEVEKPNSCLFQAALDQLHLKAEETLMVGDDVMRDIAGAKSVGMRTALVTEYREKDFSKIKANTADFVFKKVAEIVSLVGLQ